MFLSLLVICLLAIIATETSPYAPHKLDKRAPCNTRIVECCSYDQKTTNLTCAPPRNNTCPPGQHEIVELV
ncbi:hypothetical protein KIN20_011797 [Parelaphostrongylus tenuis]|uniref:Uncharacterized protein n=1 Tax=Parelaphostrongylus tenuis TaxID=148309 RepID=A0AAD5MVI4_PARTN|nr:hypothetical protein KIN20_011797 [Parelaphostrongylus tenuis]